MEKPYFQREGNRFLLRCECGDTVEVNVDGLFKHTDMKDGTVKIEPLEQTGMRLVGRSYRAQPYKDRG